MHRCHLDKLARPETFALGGEGAGSARVGFPYVGVLDVGGEELDHPLGRLCIVGKERRRDHPDLLAYCPQLICNGPSPKVLVL